MYRCGTLRVAASSAQPSAVAPGRHPWPIRRTTGRSMKASSAPMIAGSWSTRQVKPLNCGIRCATGCSLLWRIPPRTLADPPPPFPSPQEPQLVYSPDGRYVLSNKGDAAYVFDAETLRMVAGPLRIPGGGAGIPDVDAATFSPDGGLLVLWNSGEENFILSTRTWRAVGSITPSATTVGAAFSPNGRQLAVLSNFGAQLYDVAEMGAPSRPPLVSGPVRTMNGPQNQYAVAWSHDGSLLASGGDDGTQIWNPATGKMLATLRVHPSGSRIDDVSGITFSRSDDHLFTSQADGVVTWQLNRTSLDIEDQLSSIGPPVFGDGGRVIATADGTAGVQLWNATSGVPIGKPILPGGGTVQDYRLHRR